MFSFVFWRDLRDQADCFEISNPEQFNHKSHRDRQCIIISITLSL
jgi:hypothetical protein